MNDIALEQIELKKKAEYQNNKIIALLKGYKTRKLIRKNEEIISYILQIRNLQEQESIDKGNFEVQTNLKTKKHIFIHTLNSLSRLKKQSKKKKKIDSL